MYNHLIGAGMDRWQSGSYTPGQIALMSDYSSPSILYSGAYRAGKTEICAREAIRHSLAFRGARFGVFRAKLKSLKQSTLRTVLELLPPELVEDWNNSELLLRLTNGSEMFFLGCDFPDRIGSIELSGAFIDEAHEVSEESFGMIVGRLSTPLQYEPEYLEAVGLEHLKEYAQDHQKVRQTLLACNPKAKGHWLYRDFIDEDTRLPGRTFYSSNTITNSNLPDSYLLQNLAQYARPGTTEEEIRELVFRIREGKDPQDGMHLVPKLTPFGQRNLLGLWVALEGAIYTLDPRVHYLDVPQWAGLPQKYWAGVDFGYHHPRIIVAAQYSCGLLQTVGYWGGKNSSPDELVGALEQLNGDFGGIDGIFFPHDQPGIVSKARKILGSHKIRKADNKVMSGIGSIQVGINRGSFLIGPQLSSFSEDHRSLAIKELEGYSWKRSRDGQWIDEPEKVDDHFPDAIRYLGHTLAKLKLWDPLEAPSKEKPLPLEEQWLEAVMGHRF
jgi:hypothetical protein